jgi:hypothetical protein
MLGREARIVSACPVTGEEIRLEVGMKVPVSGSEGVVHFSLPARLWWEDIGET